MTLLGYFWDRWQFLAGKLSWDVTITQIDSALHPSRVAKWSTSFSWGKGGKVTTAGWQLTLCDRIWHVISRSGVVISIMNCYVRVYFTFGDGDVMGIWGRRVEMRGRSSRCEGWIWGRRGWMNEWNLYFVFNSYTIRQFETSKMSNENAYNYVDISGQQPWPDIYTI